MPVQPEQSRLLESSDNLRHQLTAIPLYQFNITVPQIANNDFAERFSTWKNGDANEIVIQRIGAVVHDIRSATVPTNITTSRRPLYKVQGGWGNTPFNDSLAMYPAPEFDFEWNYLVSSRQSRYSQSGFVSSDVLAGADRAKMLDLRVPLVVPTGEIVVFQARPLFFNPSGNVTVVPLNTQYLVGFVCLGYRRG